MKNKKLITIKAPAGALIVPKNEIIAWAVRSITDVLINDTGYYESWKANIAMAYIDNERWYKEKTKKKTLNRKDKRIIANNAAEYFLKLLCS